MPSDITPQNTTFLLRILSKFINQIADLSLIEESTDISLSRRQFEILKILYVSGAFSVSDLARFLMISRAAASKSIHNLVQSGLIQRTTPETDRRMAIVAILPVGKRIVQKYFELLHQQESRITDYFDKKELNTLENTISRYIRFLMNEYQDKADIICLHCNTQFADSCPLALEGQKSCYHAVVQSEVNVV